MDTGNGIERLRITHRPKQPGDDRVVRGARHSVLLLDTCQRSMTIDLEHGAQLPPLDERVKVHKGQAAYQFLLEVTTGLRSAIPGETNVFGQFKKAWAQFQAEGPAERVARLVPVIRRIIDDTKVVRSAHLEGIGGSSYGSLVRRLIGPRMNERVLFVGAGDLTQSMLPFFRNCKLGIWNRRPVTLADGLVDYHFRPEDGKRAARWAAHVILTTPRDAHNDENWLRWLEGSDTRNVIHLGHRGGTPIHWGAFVAGYDLEDVFALRREQADTRSTRLETARAACRELALNYVADERRELHSAGYAVA